MKADRFKALSPAARRQVIGELSDHDANAILYDWEFWARPAQLAPPGDWVNWLILAGRGFGKTRVGAEQVRRWTKEFPIVNLIGPALVRRDRRLEVSRCLLGASRVRIAPRCEAAESRGRAAQMPIRPVARESRRSTRVRLKVLIEVQGTAQPLSGEGETIVVNRHGALISTAVALRMGMRIQIRVILSDERALADVVYIDPEQPRICGIGLVKPQNIWGLALPPDDWNKGDSEPAPE